MKVSSDIVKRLNKKYVSEVPVRMSVKPDFRGFFDKHSLFIQNAISRGSCLTLHDVDFKISETTFWNPETFEDYARFIFWMFNERFLSRLLNNLEGLALKDIRFLTQILRENPEPYLWAIDHPTDPYLFFCGKKLTSLNKHNLLAKAYEIDRYNRTVLLNALLHLQTLKGTNAKTPGGPKALAAKREIEYLVSDQKLITNIKEEIEVPKIAEDNLVTKIVETEDKTEAPEPEPKPNRSKPFTAMLKSPELKNQIQEHLRMAGIPFSIFQKARKVGNNRNQAGFNSAVAAMIVVFNELEYFKEDIYFGDILDAYLKETKNNIGKLNHFKRHYRESDYFQTYFENLEDLELTKIQ